MKLVAFVILASAFELQFCTRVEEEIRMEVGNAISPSFVTPTTCSRTNPYCGPGKACRSSNKDDTGVCIDVPSKETIEKFGGGNTYCSPQINLCLSSQSCYLLPPIDVEHKTELELSTGKSMTGICLDCSNDTKCTRSKDCCFGYGCFAFMCFRYTSGFGRII
eukprot:496314_1